MLCIRLSGLSKYEYIKEVMYSYLGRSVAWSGMGELVALGTTGQGQGVALPFRVGRAGDRAALRFLEFFTVHIRNPNTGAAYSLAAAEFLE
jgi:hypothetical protein